MLKVNKNSEEELKQIDALLNKMEESVEWIKDHKDRVDKDQIYKMLLFIINHY